MEVISIAVSTRKGTPKVPVEEATVLANHGLKGDAHSGQWHRQVSLLVLEDIKQARRRGLDVSYGAFGENIATRGIDCSRVPEGLKLIIGDSVELEITQKGKVCRSRCAIYYRAGACIMPKKGVFARVTRGGKIRQGDRITMTETKTGLNQ